MKIKLDIKSLPYQIKAIDQANQLVEEHLYIVKAIVFKKFSHYNFAIDDLISIGYLALIEASRKWEDCGKGRFFNYAYPFVFRKILHWIRDEKANGRSLSPMRIDNYDKIIELYKGTCQDYLEQYDRYLTIKQLNRLIELAKLTSKEKRITVLHLQGKQYKEIAQMDNDKLSAVSAAGFKGIRKLRNTAIAINLASKIVI